MTVSRIRRSLPELIETAGLIAAAAGVLIYPKELTGAAREGLSMCFNVLLPGMFPFFVLSALAVELGLAERAGRLAAPLMGPLFRVGGAGASALMLGFVGGYPVGAKTVIALYKRGAVSKAEAERLLAFSNNAGPAFVLGVVGGGLFGSGRIGLSLYLAHIVSSIAVGVVFRSWGDGRITTSVAERTEPAPFPKAFVTAVSSSFTAMLGICGFVVFFTVLVKLLFVAGILEGLAAAVSRFGVPIGAARAMLTGLIELTGGVWGLRDSATSVAASVAMASFMLGWAGLSVHCQVLSFLLESGLSPRGYILGKLLHGVVSALLTTSITRVFDLGTTVPAAIWERLGALSRASFLPALALSILSAAVVGAIFALAAKKAGNPRRKGL